MKTSEKKRQADYILLHTILGFYLRESMDHAMFIPRYLELENINEIVNPFYKLKQFVQRIEWLGGSENVDELVNYMANNNITIEELHWAIDMFTIQKQVVLDRMEKELCTNE